MNATGSMEDPGQAGRVDPDPFVTSRSGERSRDVSWVEVSRGSAFADVISPLPSARRTRSKSSRWFGS